MEDNYIEYSVIYYYSEGKEFTMKYYNTYIEAIRDLWEHYPPDKAGSSAVLCVPHKKRNIQFGAFQLWDNYETFIYNEEKKGYRPIEPVEWE